MPAEDLKPSIRDLPLFSELTVAEMRQLMRQSAIRRFRRGEFVFVNGDEYHGFFVVLRGRIKVFQSNREGKEQILHLLGPREIFAEVPLLTGGPYPANAQALEDSILLCIYKAGFLDLLRQNSDLSLRLLGAFAKRMREITTRLEDLSLKEVTSRLARYVLDERQKSPIQAAVELSISKATLAAFLGTIPETLSRSFRQLEDAGAITVNGKRIVIRDQRLLRQMDGS